MTTETKNVKRVLVLKNTTDEHLTYIVALLEERLRDWRDSDADTDGNIDMAATFNLLCDLGVDGYEI